MERQTAHPIHELLKQRWSPRAFSDRPVEPAKLQSLMEAARWAASCFNEQPWSFIVATKHEPAEHQRLVDCLVEKNQQWARAAPVLMISIASLSFRHNGKPNRHAFYDVGAAAACMTIEATALGLHVHQMAGFHVEKARAAYNIPESAEPAAAIALGYLGDASSLPEEFRSKEQTLSPRKPISEFVFSGGWGSPAAWAAS